MYGKYKYIRIKCMSYLQHKLQYNNMVWSVIIMLNVTADMFVTLIEVNSISLN
jgi:hypothetical protein